VTPAARLLLALVLCAALAACGSDDAPTLADGGSGPAATPTAPAVESPTPTASPAKSKAKAKAKAKRKKSSNEAAATPEASDDSDDSATKSKPKKKAATKKKPTAKRKKRKKKVDPRAVFIATVDAACADYRRRELDARKQNNGSKERQIKYLDTVVSLLGETMDRMRGISRPPGDNSLFDDYLAKVQELQNAVRKLRDSTAKPSRSYASDAKRVSDLSAEARRIARDYGFQICGKEPD
jgi:hypothetical protein